VNKDNNVYIFQEFELHVLFTRLILDTSWIGSALRYQNGFPMGPYCIFFFFVLFTWSHNHFPVSTRLAHQWFSGLAMGRVDCKRIIRNDLAMIINNVYSLSCPDTRDSTSHRFYQYRCCHQFFITTSSYYIGIDRMSIYFRRVINFWLTRYRDSRTVE